MAEQEKIQQQLRQQYKVAQNNVQNALDVQSKLALATLEFTSDLAEKGVSYREAVRAQADRAAQEALAAYRQLYREGFNVWQGYLQGVSEILSQAAQD